MPHSYTLHLPITVHLDDKPKCQALTGRTLKPCKQTASVRIGDSNVCHVHAGAFLAYGSLLLDTGQEIVDLEHEKYHNKLKEQTHD